MKVKKFLSIVLSLTLIFSPLVAKGVYANRSEFSEDECWKDCIKNSKGGYESDLCAGKEAEKILLSGEKDCVVIKDVGPLANEEIYYFTFRALDKILDELGLDDNEDKLREELQRLRKERISYFSTLKNMLRVGVGSSLGAWGGNGLYNLARSEYRRYRKAEIKSLKKSTKNILNLGIGAMRFIGAICAGLLTAVLLKIKYDECRGKERELFNKEHKIYKLNEKKADALDFILYHIKNSNHLLEENFFAVHALPKEIWRFEYGNIEGLNFTEEEKASLPEKMEKLAQDIEENLGRRLHRD